MRSIPLLCLTLFFTAYPTLALKHIQVSQQDIDAQLTRAAVCLGRPADDDFETKLNAVSAAALHNTRVHQDGWRHVWLAGAKEMIVAAAQAGQKYWQLQLAISLFHGIQPNAQEATSVALQADQALAKQWLLETLADLPKKDEGFKKLLSYARRLMKM